MVQLILDIDGYNLSLPESRNGGYTAYKEVLADSVEMISGRIVREVRGNRWIVKYQYGYFDNTMMNKILTVCDKGIRQSIKCSFLTQESTEKLTTVNFLVSDYARPKFMWSRNGMPLWADFSITLKEVDVID